LIGSRVETGRVQAVHKLCMQLVQPPRRDLLHTPLPFTSSFDLSDGHGEGGFEGRLGVLAPHADHQPRGGDVGVHLHGGGDVRGGGGGQQGPRRVQGLAHPQRGLRALPEHHRQVLRGAGETAS
jgi:hypothetical protein